MVDYSKATDWTICRYYFKMSEVTGNPYAVLFVRRKSLQENNETMRNVNGNVRLFAANFFADNRERVKSIYFADKEQMNAFHSAMKESYQLTEQNDTVLKTKIYTINKTNSPNALNLPTILLCNVEITVQEYCIPSNETKSGFYEESAGVPRIYTTTSALFAVDEINGEYRCVEGDGDAEAILTRRFNNAISNGTYVAYSTLKQSSTQQQVNIDLIL